MTTLVRDRVAEHRLTERWLARLRHEVEHEVELRGGFRGRIRPAQRAWSYLLDRLQHDAQEAA